MSVHLVLMKDPVFFMAQLFMSDMKKCYLETHDESGNRTEDIARKGWTAFAEYIEPMFPKDFPMAYMASYFAKTFVMLEKALYDPHREMHPDEVMGFMMMAELSEKNIFAQQIYNELSVPKSTEFLFDDDLRDEFVRIAVEKFEPVTEDEFIESVIRFDTFVKSRKH